MRLACAGALALILFVSSFGTALAAPRGGTPTGQHAEALEADIDARCHAVMELIYASQLSEAIRVADELAVEAPEDPRTHLLQARVLRETFPDQNTNGDHLEALTKPIQAHLDRAIAASTRLVEADERSLPGYVYRGWAHLFRAQMHTLCGEYWAAGRQAKAGKNDLDRALALDPENPDAQCVLGTYLYFADVLPAIVKLARTLVRVPGGDRVRGMELLGRAAASNGYNRLDARALAAVIEFAFEGDLDAAKRRFESFLVDNPDNPRLLEPLAVMRVFSPEDVSGPQVETVIAKFANDAEAWNRELASRLSLYRALDEFFTGHFDAARSRLELLRRDSPEYPDWFLPDVMLCAGEMALLCGDREAAVAISASAAQPQASDTPDWLVDRHRKIDERLRFLRDRRAVASAEEVVQLRRVEVAARGLYDGDAGAAAELLQASPDTSFPAAAYYRAEAARRAGRQEEALAAYHKLTEAQLPGRWRLFKVLAFAHAAEIQAARGDTKTATHTLERCLEFDADRDLLRHALRARHRWFEHTGDRAADSHDAAPPPPTAH